MSSPASEAREADPAARRVIAGPLPSPPLRSGSPGTTMARPRRAIVGWVLFDWACQPFFTLVTTFVFAPVFCRGPRARSRSPGQALWGYATAAAGLTLAVLSPVLGSIADASGPRKPWIAISGAVLVVASASLWFAAPGAPHGIVLALVAFAVATVAVEVAAVFNNAMMVQLVPPERLGRLSGAGWATGYAGGLVSLVVVLGFLAASPETGTTYFGLTPLFGLDPAQREGDRIAGPFSAAWFVVFVLPLFLFTPDAARSGRPLAAAMRHGLTRLAATVGGGAPGRHPRPLPPRQHGLSGRARGAVRLRRHLRGGRVRLGHARARRVRHPPDRDRHDRGPRRRAARRSARTETRHPRRARRAHRRLRRHPVARA